MKKILTANRDTAERGSGLADNFFLNLGVKELTETFEPFDP